MTTEEKRMQLTTYCAARSCSRCPLHRGFRCGDGESFLKKKADGSYSMANRTIENAYELAIGSKKFAAPTVANVKRKPASAYHDCPYASCLECDSTDEACSSCGWNPAVEEERKKRLEAVFLMPPDKCGLRGLRLKKKKSHE